MAAQGRVANPSSGGGATVNWELIQLDNGAQLVLAPMPGRQSVAASVLVRVGSRWESTRLAGVSHFLEHIVFKGTRHFPTSRSVSESIEGIGGILNASTDKELTNFWVKVPGGHLEEALRLLFDLAFAPTIDEAEVERERNVVVEELHSYLDQPGELVEMIFDRLLWGDHPLARDPAGNRASLFRIGSAELSSYRRTFYIPDRVVVVVTGGFDPGEAQSLVERCFAERDPDEAAPAGRLTDGGVPARLSDQPEAKLRRRRGEQVHILLGVRCPSYLDPDRWTLDVLNTALGEGMSSRLFLELRENQALAYDVHSLVSRHRDSGSFAVYMATQPRQLQTAVRGALAEVRKLVREPIGRDELARTKTRIEGRLYLQLEGTSSMAEYLGQQAALTETVLSPEEVIAAVRAVSADEVQELAQRLFVGVGWRLAAVGPVGGCGDTLSSISDGVAG
jgi:predicted Zn-dependent peptidase